MPTRRWIEATAKQTVAETAASSRYKGLMAGISLLLSPGLPNALFEVDSPMILQKNNINCLFIMRFRCALRLFTVKRSDLIDRHLTVLRKGLRLGGIIEPAMLGVRGFIERHVRPLMDWTEEEGFTE
jgi:hypothetical protein